MNKYQPKFYTLAALLISICLWTCLGIGVRQANAQDPPAILPPPVLRLSTGGEVPLTDFIDYVSQRLKVRLLYDESIRQKKVNLVAPDPIPVDSLFEILNSLLINEGLVITDTDQQGFKRITTNSQIPIVARPSNADEKLSSVGAAVPLTRVFTLAESRPSSVAEIIKPLLSSTGATVVPIDAIRLLIVTDVAKNILRVEQMIDIVDDKQAQVEIEFVQAKHVTAETLAEQLRQILTARQKAIGMSGESSDNASAGVEVSVNDRTNNLILIGAKRELERAKVLLERLDRALDTQQRTFTLQYYSPKRFEEVVKGIVASQTPPPPYQARVEGNALIVNSTPQVLDLISRTQRDLDTREAPDTQSPVRFYKIKNVPAEELLETIRGIGSSAANRPRRRPLPRRRQTTNDLALPGPNLSPLQFPGRAQPVQNPLIPPAFRDESDVDPATTIGEQDQRINDRLDGFQQGFPDLLVDIDESQPVEDGAVQAVRDAEVTVDVHTNTIIVVADPEVQRIYARLIDALDQRRPQVLIEAQVVIIDTTDDYTLGVEVSGGDRTGTDRLFSFSSFGLSTVDATSGSLAILPGVGFNGALVDPNTADVVVRALANHRRARVLSVPRILVNDNSEGQLTSVLEVPFTSVNASQTVATTSFAGFAEAGTTITATPTISDDNYLQLDYAVTLNSFTGVGTDGVPPPRQTNEVRSRVTIPDGYTVIVGGLTSKNESSDINGIPWLELLPVIRRLASRQTDNWQETSLFVFLKPVILREDRFKDLRFLSDVERNKADMPGNFPANRPMLIK